MYKSSLIAVGMKIQRTTRATTEDIDVKYETNIRYAEKRRTKEATRYERITGKKKNIIKISTNLTKLEIIKNREETHTLEEIQKYRKDGWAIMRN